MRRHLIAAAAGVATVALTWAVAAGISDERPRYPGQAQIVGDAIEAIAPNAAGGECHDTTRMMPIRVVRVADDLVRVSRRSPNVMVPAPNGEGEVALGEVPGVLADSLQECLDQNGAPGPGWARLVTRLRG